MHLAHLPGKVHLTYCTNIHAGENWDEVRSSLEAHIPQIKAQVSPNAAFGVGLRLSAIAAEALGEPAALEEFRDFLSRHDLYVFTIVAREAGISSAEAADALQKHLGVCYDICHGAVEFENPADAFAQLAAAGIRVGKLQLSSALRLPEVAADTEKSLSAFDDGVYLH